MWQYLASSIESEHPALLSAGLGSVPSGLGDHKFPVGQEDEVQGTHLAHRMPQHHHTTAFDLQVGSSLELALDQVLHNKQL